jgi:hypothetical protein
MEPSGSKLDSSGPNVDCWRLRAAHDLTVHVLLADVDVLTVVDWSPGKPVPGDTPGTGTLVQRFEQGSVADTRSASPG